ncbi:MAG: 1-acyl-sn-glycerol-3-phosphate acyltransferase [Pirellulales bacterium]|nr:1-acyl-sn-glycerol-3-phosphate acyltransferase [Pirellulales bacterium]
MLSALGTKILAVAILAALGLAMAAWTARFFRRSPYTPVQTAILTTSALICRLLWRTEISGRLPIAPGRGAVIISNHTCSFDPAFIALGVDRVMRWMVAREYCEHRFMGKFLRPFGPIPTNRAGIDTAATKQIIRCAQQGELVGLFPEGRINDTGRLLRPGRPGVALIALRAGVPVIPCFIRGAPYDGTALGCLRMPARVRVTVGKPIDLAEYRGREDDRAVLEDLTKRLMKAIAALGGQPDYEPELAGRFYKPSAT